MADPKGFMTTPREVASRRPVAERVHDWHEVYPESPGKAVLPIITKQAGRCMDCGIPFCHQGCPLGNLIPEWNDLAWKGNWHAASERLHATNNFPEFTSRICPAPCESPVPWASMTRRSASSRSNAPSSTPPAPMAGSVPSRPTGRVAAESPLSAPDRRVWRQRNSWHAPAMP